MSGWSAPFAKRVLESWAAHSKSVGAEAVADRIKSNIKNKITIVDVQTPQGSSAAQSPKTRASAVRGKATTASKAPAGRPK
jgi:hypothetical protein